ncbi:MAG: aspartate--ammonia ligase, partial [Bacteroidaceae bacterium]|nr:aspartate--ammonia ligase [Bacteroidaceae bacterium]
RKIYSAMLRTEYLINETYPQLEPFLAREVFFIHSEELRRLYPDMSAKEREDAITKEHGTVFIMGIGGNLEDGKPHDLRAPDYDDWTTPNSDGFCGLNGDLLVWNSILDRSIELSSMGIRVDKKALLHQLELTGQEDRKELYFHKKLLNGELPLCIGGGIGQSRLCMLFLQKAHIGEIQASIWPEDQIAECKKAGIELI